MSDDFKLSVSVEADLTRLDNSLNQAIAKTRAAGRQMQEAMHGGTGGYMGTSSLAGMAPSSPTMPGTPISWGNNLNASAGNGMMPPIPPTAWQKFANNFMGKGGLGFGMPLAVTAGIIAAQTRMQVNKSVLGTTLAGQNMFMAAARGDTVSAYSYQAQAEESIRNMPLVGGIMGYAVDNSRLASRIGSNLFGGQNTSIGRALQSMGMDPRVTSEAALENEKMRIQNNRGIFGGGYLGELAEIKYKYGTLAHREIQDMAARGVESSVLEDRQAELNRSYRREMQENDIKRKNDLRSIKSATTQANMNAFGYSGLANIVGIQTQFANELAMTNPEDKARRDALKSLQSSQIMAEVMGNMQPAQAITPGTMELGGGAVRTGSVRNQDPDTLRALMNLGDKLGQFPPLVTR